MKPERHGTALRGSSAAIDKFKYRAIVIERNVTAKLPDGSEDVVEARAVQDYGRFLQTLFTKKFSGGIFRFSHTVGDQDDAVPGIQFHLVAFVFRDRQQSYGQISMLKLRSLAIRDQQRWHVAAIQDFSRAVGRKMENNGSGIFFALDLLAQETICGGDDLR